MLSYLLGASRHRICATMIPSNSTSLFFMDHLSQDFIWSTYICTVSLCALTCNDVSRIIFTDIARVLLELHNVWSAAFILERGNSYHLLRLCTCPSFRMWCWQVPYVWWGVKASFSALLVAFMRMRLTWIRCYYETGDSERLEYDYCVLEIIAWHDLTYEHGNKDK